MSARESTDVGCDLVSQLLRGKRATYVVAAPIEARSGARDEISPRLNGRGYGGLR